MPDYTSLFDRFNEAQAEGQQPAPEISDATRAKLAQTWPARMARDAWDAVTLPGDVYQGNVQVGTPEYYDRAAALSGLVTSGTLAAPPVKDAVGMGVRAYHGSPHNFDRFDISKIGTGEGNQVYGHGLYFAENPEVAKAYRDTLVNRVRSDPMAPSSTPEQLAWYWLNMSNGNSQRAGSGIKQQISLLMSDGEADAAKKMKDALYLIEGGARGLKPPAQEGKIYEVNIGAEAPEFLSWENPLRDQANRPQGLVDLAYGAAEQANKARQARLDRGTDAFGKPLKPSEVEFLSQRMDPEAITGEKLYDLSNVRNFGAKSRYEKSPETSQWLNEMGIPGIRYRDQGSRMKSGADATHNYVVFNDRLIDIIKKYGWAGVAAALGAEGYGPAPLQNGQM